MTKSQPSESQTWFQPYVDAANLPRSEFSTDFINETLAEAGDPTRVGAQATPKKGATPKRRRNKSPVDMNKGFPLTPAAANALVRAGAKLVSRPGQLPGTVVNTAAASSSSNTAVAPSSSNIAVAPSSSTEASNATTTNVSTEPSIPASTSPAAGPGTPSDASDEDPEDETFTPEGKRKVSGPSSVKKRAKTTAKES